MLIKINDGCYNWFNSATISDNTYIKHYRPICQFTKRIKRVEDLKMIFKSHKLKWNYYVMSQNKKRRKISQNTAWNQRLIKLSISITRYLNKALLDSYIYFLEHLSLSCNSLTVTGIVGKYIVAIVG